MYCSARPSTRVGDHVFARSFFLERYRANLPKVPACEDCGNAKSSLEHYLATILPFASTHADAEEALLTHIPGRLIQNKKLHRAIERGTTNILLRSPAGMLQPTIALDIDCSTLLRLYRYITKALTYHHRGIRLGNESFVETFFAGYKLAAIFHYLWCAKSADRIKYEIGAGTVSYAASFASSPEDIAVWRISLPGTAALVSIDWGNGEALNEIWALTGPKRVQDAVEVALKATGSILLGEKPAWPSSTL